MTKRLGLTGVLFGFVILAGAVGYWGILLADLTLNRIGFCEIKGEAVSTFECTREWIGATSGWAAAIAAGCTIYVLIDHSKELQKGNHFSRYSQLAQIKGELMPEFDLGTFWNKLYTNELKITGRTYPNDDIIHEFLGLLIQLSDSLRSNRESANRFLPEEVLENRKALENYLRAYIEGWKIREFLKGNEEGNLGLTEKRTRVFVRHLRKAAKITDPNQIVGPSEIHFLYLIIQTFREFTSQCVTLHDALKLERIRNAEEVGYHDPTSFTRNPR
ncbi:hypothetical protein SAMN04488518_11372 [Pseudovibrio ascidiaceicola]|uniref:Uncharacterized protein n=1 Tax=Pseudovibrio ascidiaceicola TaxID=285279 RepID=A0A1I4E338_9HYPH|nr:hypothetical protein [Pseudovibrio ascidiaceicola]SFK98601.1 hypothetical protein SAMN04488518_11372 [Pseudovibrio ascidiaceicola]